MYRTFLVLMIFTALAGTKAIAYRADPTPAEMSDLDKEIAAEPGNSRPIQYRGLNYAVLGKAIADYKAALKISPDQAWLYWSFGWALFDLGDYPSSRKVWQVAATLTKKRRRMTTRSRTITRISTGLPIPWPSTTGAREIGMTLSVFHDRGEEVQLF